MCIIGTYTQTNDASEEEQIYTYGDSLRDVIKNTPNRKRIFLLENLNARVGKHTELMLLEDVGKKLVMTKRDD